MAFDLRNAARLAALMIVGTLAVLAPRPAAALDDSDFWMLTPNAWIDKRDSLGNDLIRQMIARDRNAFIEVYGATGNAPALETVADAMERHIRSKGGTYLSQRISSQRRPTSDGVDAIAREYAGLHNGVPLRALTYTATTPKGAVVAIGVFVEPMADRYQKTVYDSVLSLRFTPPGQARAPAKRSYLSQPSPSATPHAATAPATDLCAAVARWKWHWFTGNTYAFEPNGRIGNARNHWRCLDPASGTIHISWNKGKWSYTVKPTPDGRRLEGKNESGIPVWAKRVN